MVVGRGGGDGWVTGSKQVHLFLNAWECFCWDTAMADANIPLCR